MARLARLVEAADRDGLVVILGLFYFGQVKHVAASAVPAAVDAAVAWVLDGGYTNVAIEIDNECNNAAYASRAPDTLPCGVVDRMIERVHADAAARGRTLLAGASIYHAIPPDSLIAASDFVLLHGNGWRAGQLAAAIDAVRASAAFTRKPVVVNEDDHLTYDSVASSNFLRAVSLHASWGFFDPHVGGTDGYYTGADGYQAPPIDWGFDSPTKQAFFQQVKQLAGVTANVPPYVVMTTPRPGSAVASVVLRAAASDVEGPVTAVVYREGGTQIARVTASADHAYNWRPPPGQHTVTATAYDPAGASTTSAPVTFRVRAPA